MTYGLRVADVRELASACERSQRRTVLWEEVKARLEESAMGLSGGQQQRLCIARAIAVKPEIILMDEPCSALDPRSTAKIEELISKLRGGYTIVIVRHIALAQGGDIQLESEIGAGSRFILSLPGK